MRNHDIKLSQFQKRVLAIDPSADIFLGGGRGGSKSHAIALLIFTHIQKYGPLARVLYVRRSHRGSEDFRFQCLELFGSIFRTSLKYNSQEGIFKFPNGATLEINQLETPNDYLKYQGRGYTMLCGDELQQFAEPDLLDRLRSNLRGPREIAIRCVLAANPGDVGHQWIAKRYVFAAEPWTPFIEKDSGRIFVHAPSTFLDNPFIDQEQYRKQLSASCPSDPELLRAWLNGDWSIARGAYFGGGVLEESRNAVPNWTKIPADWRTYLCHDFGSSAPSVTYIVAKSPGGKGPDGLFYPRRSLVLVSELASNEPGNVSKGMGYTVPVLAERIKEMCKQWKVDPDGVADDAIFAQVGHSRGSISDEFRSAGVHFVPAKKADRMTGWNVMRRLLQDAGKPDVPGLYVARHCEYFWSTVPYLGRDPKKVEDLDSRGPDHAADAVRYGCLRESQTVQKVRLGGV